MENHQEIKASVLYFICFERIARHFFFRRKWNYTFFKRNLNIISNFKKLNEMCNENVLEKKLERKLGIEYR